MKSSLLLSVLLVATSSFGQTQEWPSELLTKPERTSYMETSTYAEVMMFIEEVKKGSDYVTQVSMGKSLEGKEIPVLILANPKISTPAEAKASGKPIIYIQGNIHSGEVEGKEVIQILMREILHGNKAHLLKNQIILFTPIYNTDSNDKFGIDKRPSQEGSPVETGLRAGSQGWDLNRDGIKMEALETNALIQNIIVPWDPTLFVDLHTTNGTWHGYSLTWAPSYHSAGEKAPYDFTWNKFLPEVTEKVLRKNEIHLGPFGDFYGIKEWPIKQFYTYNHHPRYLVNQFGLRNRMAILSEAFAHERLYQRMTSTHAFVNEILEFTNQHGKEMMAINAKAEADAIKLVKEQAGKIKKGVRFKMVPLEKPMEKYRVYDHYTVKDSEGKISYVRAPNIIELENIENNSAFEATVESTLPKGYIIPAEFEFIAKHLEKQGVTVTKSSKSMRATGESFLVEKYMLASRPFEKHNMATVEGKFVSETYRAKKGDYYVDLAQPLANLIFYMLEPQSDDGLVTWNFFDDYFKKNGIDKGSVKYPVFKYVELK